MNVSMKNEIINAQDMWVDIKELAEYKGLKTTRSLRLNKDKYFYRTKQVKGGTTYEFLLTSLEPEIQEKILQKFYNRITIETVADLDKPLIVIQPNENNLIIPEAAKKEALAKYDLVKLWRDFVKGKKIIVANTEFLDLYNTGMLASNIYNILGKISLGSLHRWKRQLKDNDDYLNLVSKNYSLSGEYKSTLTDLEKNILMRILLNPRQFSIGKAISMTTYILQKQGYEQLPAPITFKRYVDWFKKNNYDKWVLAREGEKALRDKIEPFLVRDAKILNVFDVLVADGHTLNFQIINPFTGKPARATLVGFLDWRSGALVGYEIMLEENTQAIASALRNAILNIGAIPRIVYQDNGRAFKSKFFQGDKNFEELGFQGIYAKLGIKSVFAKPYNAQSKVIERFFLEFQESFEKMLPSYIGTSIENKPAYIKRNEKFHKSIHNGYTPTIQEAMRMIDLWIEYRNSQPCPIEPDKTIAEVLATVKKQKISEEQLDDLMMAQKIAHIGRNGIRFLKTDYYDDKLYGFREKVLIKYSLFDLSEIKVYSMRGKFICTAKRVLPTHPMAYQMGTVQDIEDYKYKIKKKAQLRKKTIKAVENYLSNDELKFLEQEMELKDIKELTDNLPPVKKSLTTNKKVFKNNFERFDYLQTKENKTEEESAWLIWFKTTDEYKEIYK